MEGILARLRSSGADPAAMEAELARAAACAVSSQGKLECMRVLEEAGWDWTKATSGFVETFRTVSLLDEACRGGDEAMVMYLLDKGCDPLLCAFESDEESSGASHHHVYTLSASFFRTYPSGPARCYRTQWRPLCVCDGDDAASGPVHTM